MERLLTIKEICDLLQVSRSTVYEWTHIGFIPHYKLPNAIRFKESDINSWIQRKFKRGRAKVKVEVEVE